MSQLDAVLEKSIVFGSLEPADLGRLEPLFQKWPINTGDILCTAGNKAQFFFLLETGCLLLAMEEGKAAVLDCPGDLAAMEMVSSKGVCITSITALESGTVWALSREEFLLFIQEDTPAAASVMAGWQTFLDQKAPFAKTLTDIDLPVMF